MISGGLTASSGVAASSNTVDNEFYDDDEIPEEV
jgi:hypothetical protein